MKSALILSALVILVHGRPEPPSGYNYASPPSSRYGAPSGNQGQGQDQGGFRSSNGQSGFGGGFGAGSGGSFAGSVGSGSNGGGFTGSLGAGQSSSTAGLGQSNAGQSGRSSSGGSGGSSTSGDIIINKHVYVHVAPPELEEESQAKAKVRLPPLQKNYKIIFIKAPSSATAGQTPQIPPIPQNEEKTIVYVLVKKPEDQAEIEIPTAAPTEPSRPEVYFIKYKTQQESGGQQGANGGGSFTQDDTVEVGAREGGQGGATQGGNGASQGGNGASQGGNGASQGGNGASQGSYSASTAQASGQQNGASAGGYSSSRSSAGVSRQYGAPNSSSGPY